MPQFAENLTMLFNELPFLDRFAAAADASFDAVEFMFPYGHGPAPIADTLAANGQRLDRSGMVRVLEPLANHEISSQAQVK
jgi:hydroxypyruvate isomerase